MALEYPQEQLAFFNLVSGESPVSVKLYWNDKPTAYVGNVRNREEKMACCLCHMQQCILRVLSICSGGRFFRILLTEWDAVDIIQEL